MTNAEAAEAATATAGVPAASGYTVILPPGWTKIPLREGSEGVIASILDRTFAGHSRDQYASARQDLRTRLREMADAARRNGGLDLYLPTEQVHGFTLSASFVVAEVAFGSVEPLDPAHTVAQLIAAGDATRPVTVDRATGSRTESRADPDPAKDAPYASRRVDYVLPVPRDPDRWLVVSFSTIGQGDPGDEFADLLTELFDAIMSTFRWTTG